LPVNATPRGDVVHAADEFLLRDSHLLAEQGEQRTEDKGLPLQAALQLAHDELELGDDVVQVLHPAPPAGSWPDARPTGFRPAAPRRASRGRRPWGGCRAS